MIHINRPKTCKRGHQRSAFVHLAARNEPEFLPKYTGDSGDLLRPIDLQITERTDVTEEQKEENPRGGGRFVRSDKS